MEVIFAPVNNELDLRLREQSHLIAALYAELDRALNELEDMHQRRTEQEQILLEDPDQFPEEAPMAAPPIPRRTRSFVWQMQQVLQA